MVKTLNISADVPPSREMQITLPPDVPVGPTDLVVVVVPREPRQGRTLGDLLRSPYFGMWKDREDITDSVEFAQKLRRDAWKRGGE